MALYYLDFEKPIADLDKKIAELRNFSYHPHPRGGGGDRQPGKTASKGPDEGLLQPDPLAANPALRHFNRPTFLDYAERVFTDFVELHGDRKFGDDPAIVGGLAHFQGTPVVIVGAPEGDGR